MLVTHKTKHITNQNINICHRCHQNHLIYTCYHHRQPSQVVNYHHFNYHHHHHHL